MKELQFCEETSYGILPANPTFTAVGYEPRIIFRSDPKMLVVPQPNSENPQTIQPAATTEVSWEVLYRPTDMKFAKYGVNGQGGGSGTIDKSFTLLMSVQLNATTETWIILPGCRPNLTTFSGRAGGFLEIKVIGNSKSLPVPLQTNPAYTFATSSQTNPIQLKDGGLTPLTIAGAAYDVTSIAVQVNRNLTILPLPGFTNAQIVLPQNRAVNGTFGIAWETLALLTQLGTLVGSTLIWTLSQSLNSFLTVNVTQFDRLNSLQFSNGDSAIFENYTFAASSASLT